jgi:hypothetical protein
MFRMTLVAVILIALTVGAVADGINRPWIGATYFYWYTWDYQKEFGGWVGGVYNTPLTGYYDSPSYKDNLRSLRTACEWGLTDFWMDYWGPGWKADNGRPREQVVMQAAEELRRRGYDAHMSFYQDGEKFNMADFERNLDPGQDMRFYVENWGSSDALPRIGSQPVYLIYSRNGAPKPTQDNEGFRAWLHTRYAELLDLDRAWGTDYTSWDQVALGYGAGRHRADSIRYATHVWQTQWERTQKRANEELHVSGPRVSFDVAYQPYLGWGYSALAKSVGGPHSYAGIFGQPQDEDLERFIQGAVAKAYGTVFFDHFKNYYHDIEIRTPGTVYPADFCAFDRFWAGALLRRSEAMLHLSWNEWWEGSNLEPCWEYGKTYCEKNLLWSTVMQRCFDSLHNWNRGAKVAVLLNDWLWLTGGRNTSDVYGCIQALRRANVTFDLLPDDFVTRDRLADVELVIAPTGAAGLGANAQGQPIAGVLKDWVSQPRQAGRGPVRRLITSQMPEYLDWLGVPRDRSGKAEREPGPDMNVFVDVGEAGDERFLINGMSGRENWGALPPGAFGATDRKLTCRWTPATGLTTTFVFPFSPNRDHLLRLQGSGFRPNRATVVVGDKPVGQFEIKEGIAEYEVRIPAAAVGGSRVAEVKLVYEKANVPTEIDPAHFPSENRVCNLGLDWVQLSTDNIPAHATKQNYSFPKERAEFAANAPGGLARRSADIDWMPHDRLAVPAEAVRSRYASDGAPRDFVIRKGENEVWYVNGLTGADSGALLGPLVHAWAGLKAEWQLEGDHVLGTRLKAGDNTEVVVVYNYDTTHRPRIRVTVPTGGRTLVEATALSRDGEAFHPLSVELTPDNSELIISDQIRYYAAYEIAFGPVRAQIPRLILTPGGTQRFDVALDNKERRLTSVSLSLLSPVPTLTANAVSTELKDFEAKTVPFEIACAPDADWGEKTVVFDLATSGRHTTLWRRLTVLRAPEPEIVTTALDQAHPKLLVRNTEHPLIRSGTAQRVRVKVAEREQGLGPLASGATADCLIAAPPAGDRPAVVTRLAEVSWLSGSQLRQERVQPVRIATYPATYHRAPGALAPVLVFNASERPLTEVVVSVPTADFGRLVKGSASRLYVRDEKGQGVASQVSADQRELLFLATVGALEGRTYYACLGEAPQTPTELAVTAQALGSGHGRVSLGNQVLELVLDEQAGATATSFRSLATNTEYGAQSFGVAHGTWGHYDPLSPATSAPQLLAGIERHSQAASPGRLALIESGPVRAVVKAEWRDGLVSSAQTYSVFSKAPHVRLASQVTLLRALRPNEEIALLDGRLRRAALTKIFPNFVGINETFSQEMVQHGFRMAPYVPDVFTCLTPDAFKESVSFVLLRHEGLDSIRQGFWPAERGKPGPCAYAWVELLSHGARASATVDLLIHPGHQPIASRHLESQRKPPMVIVPEGFTWAKES